MGSNSCEQTGNSINYQICNWTNLHDELIWNGMDFFMWVQSNGILEMHVFSSCLNFMNFVIEVQLYVRKLCFFALSMASKLNFHWIVNQVFWERRIWNQVFGIWVFVMLAIFTWIAYFQLLLNSWFVVNKRVLNIVNGTVFWLLQCSFEWILFHFPVSLSFVLTVQNGFW